MGPTSPSGHAYSLRNPDVFRLASWVDLRALLLMTGANCVPVTDAFAAQSSYRGVPMTTANLVRVDGSILINTAHIVSIVPAPMLSNAVRFDIHMANGNTHGWPIRAGEDAETALQRLFITLTQR